VDVISPQSSAAPLPARALLGTLAAGLCASALPSVALAQSPDLFSSSFRDDSIDTSAASLLYDQGLPIDPLEGDVRISGLDVTAWREGEVQRLLIEGWVAVDIGDYSFRAERAVAWISRRDVAGATRNEIVLYLAHVNDAQRPAGSFASGRELLVTSSSIGRVSLKSDLFRESAASPAGIDIVPRAEQLARSLLNPEQSAAAWTPADRGAVSHAPAPVDEPLILPEVLAQLQGGATLSDDELAGAAPGDSSGRSGSSAQQGLFVPARSTFLFRARDIEFKFAAEGESESSATLSGDLVLQYTELARRPGTAGARQITLSAQRGVIFTDPVDPQSLGTGSIDATAARSAYLEGDVTVTDGNYTLRGPRMYYDFRTGRAMVLDAVLSTYDSRVKVPIYVRADEIRQVSPDQWEADGIRVATSEFAVPTVSLGAKKAVITRQRAAGDSAEDRYRLKAKGLTLRAGDLPFFVWPGYQGDLSGFPLRQFNIGTGRQDGVHVETTWDLFALAGRPRPDNLDAELLLDYRSERGPGIGGALEYTTDDRDGRGRFSGYFIQDGGTDRLSSGVERDAEKESRGYLSGWHRQELGDDWKLLLEISKASDEAFFDSFFPEVAQTSREQQTRALLSKQEDNWAFELGAKYDLNNFIINQDLLQSQGYLVEKVPELGFWSYADSWWGGKASYSSEYRLSRMRLSFPRHTLADIGQGFAGFGLPPVTDLSAAAFAAGYRENYVDRFFTRHELAFPFRTGIFNVTPFVTAQFSGYDDDFSEFSNQAEEYRFLAATGLRIYTQFSRVDRSFDSTLFDIHGVRHIVEPSLTLWSAAANAGSNEYPIYDQDVEGANEGTYARLGVRNTWQTHRGGEGRWYTVDFLRIDADLYFAGNDSENDFVIPRFYDYRPEYSQIGDAFITDFEWLATDALTFAGTSTFDIEESDLARGSVGVRIDHSPDLFTSADIRYIEAIDDTLLNLGFGYTLSSLYRLSFTTTYDLDRAEYRGVNSALTRRTPQFDVSVGVAYDNIREDTTLTLSVSPKGLGGRSFGGVLSGEERPR